MNHHNLTQAMAERDRGQARALSHAESVEPSWGDQAYDALARYTHGMTGGKFTSHEFIRWYESYSLPMPPTNKAFGSIFTKAAKNRMIHKFGYEPHPLRHCSPTVLWEVV